MENKIGIVGFGLVGKSVLKFLSRYQPYTNVFVWDERDLDDQEHELIKKYGGTFLKTSLFSFLRQNDKNIVSPGVKFSLCSNFSHVSELDLFSQHFSKKTIAITGSLGKTTVTQVIGKSLPSCETGGNIGRPMLELVDIQKDIDWAVLEISSFQAEQNMTFAPDIALWTNFYPNHLDHHENLERYLCAKWRLFAFQSAGQYGIFSKQLLNIDLLEKFLQSYRGKAIFVPEGKNGFESNELLCQACLDVLGAKKEGCKAIYASHRCEHFATFHGIDFYNDSKATVVQATLAAVARLAGNSRPIMLIVGGQNKGVDRSAFLKNLYKETLIKKIFCLGKSCSDLVGCERYASLSDLVHAIMQAASSGDQVLFSPSGASFDLFTNYKERGELFKKMVLELYGER